jgi:cation:H+ antiporter
LGGNWIGLILIASVTSLPELMTGFSSIAIFNVPDIATGDVLGSCMFNILIIALLDLRGGAKPFSAQAHQGQVISAGFGILLLGLVAMTFAAGGSVPQIGWISLSSLIFLAVYVIAIRTVFLYEQRGILEFAKERASEAKYSAVTARRAYLLYAVNAVIIIAAATYLPYLGERISEMTGLGNTFVGSLFIAFSTSLPEVAVSIGALRIGAVDIALGNLFGSNLFNIGILAVDDLIFTTGPLLSHVSSSHIISALAALIMTAIAIIGLTYRTREKRRLFAWDSVGNVILYLVATALLYSAASS